MNTARLTLDPRRRVAPVPRRLFGSFVEHMGRCVYTGIYEPGHPTRRRRRLPQRRPRRWSGSWASPSVRYPGGNFVSGYRWEDGVGPVDERPARLDLAWHSLETNAFGLDEFMRVGRQGRRRADDGGQPRHPRRRRGRSTCSSTPTTRRARHLADLRRANGADEPYGIRLWCLGNEMDGPWQIGHKTRATEYGRLAARDRAGDAPRRPDLELVACGSSHLGDADVRQLGARRCSTDAYDEVDYISLHAYYEQVDGDLASFLASAVDMDYFIDARRRHADSVGAPLGRTKKIMIVVRRVERLVPVRRSSTPPSGEDWPVAPPLHARTTTAWPTRSSSAAC